MEQYVVSYVYIGEENHTQIDIIEAKDEEECKINFIEGIDIDEIEILGIDIYNPDEMYDDIKDPEMVISFDHEEEMDRKDMIDQLREWGQEKEYLDDMEDVEIKRLYEEIYDDRNNETDLFPNGRDYDAEDEDGI
ncbi:MAG: hypothetical protein GX987_06530 [Tissierellia bacterium]|nr:hypothetical protein [Tissierellia bacterium]